MIGTTDLRAFGDCTHRDANRKVVGNSDPHIVGRVYSHNSSNSSSGCYVAVASKI